ncbi:MAG TPA: hypothetical protein VK208_23645 [Pyrinomonadaceae bacterium]|jgi:hypothetical protein|nr:hypothetical protein [Pyrinomonadaceae bacterium]
MATSTKSRTAKVLVQKGKARSVITAFVPTKVGSREVAALNEVLINKIIKDLTGCPCLSGAVDVIFRDDLAKSINIDLASGQIG